MNNDNTSTCETFTLTARDGRQLAARCWKPHAKVVDRVGIIHGLGEHSGCYDELARQLAGAGYEVFAHDQRGHGLTYGKRGHVDDYSLLLDDIDTLVSTCLAGDPNSGNPERSSFLLGHSLGGNLTLNYVLRHRSPIAGLIITSPLLAPTVFPPLWKRAVARLLDRIWPSLTFSAGVRAIKLSHDPDAILQRQSDPLVHGRVSARLAIQMLEAGQWALEHAHDLDRPLLLMHGAADQITSVDATRQFASHVTSPCELYIAEQGYHELHHESDRAVVFERMIAWLDAQTTGKTTLT